MHYLIVGPSWVGDMVMSQVLYRHLKQQHPEAKISVLAPKWTLPLLERMPEVEDAIIMPVGHGELALSTRKAVAQELSQRDFTHAIVLPNSFKSALIPYFAKIPQRRGWRGEMRYGLLTDHQKLSKQKYPLMIERFAALAYPWGTELPELLLPKLQVNSQQVQQALNKFNLNLEKPVIGFGPGAEFGPSKQWPAAYFADLATKLTADGYQIWVFGSRNDSAISQAICDTADADITNLSGITSLAEAIDLLSVTTKAVCNDSGLMHIACALEKPVVAVFGSTSPEFTPPLGEQVAIIRSELSCSPCFKRTCRFGHMNCLKQLDPEQIYQKCSGLVA